MNILVTGASGVIGSVVSSHLRSNGHQVFALTRTGNAPCWNIEQQTVDFGSTQYDVVIHLAGENIAAGRWTAARKERIRASRVNGTRLLCNKLAQLADKPALLICASAVGIYGDCGTREVDEQAAPGRGFLAEVCAQWEQACQPAVTAGIRVVHLRLGMVLDGNGGALQKMLPPFKLGLGGKIGSGGQYMSWITSADVAAITEFIIEHPEISGAVNCCTPTAATNAEFTNALGTALQRPTPLPVPAAAINLIFGEMGRELLLSSARVRPTRLLDWNYPFRHPNLPAALAYCLNPGTVQ